MSETESCMKCLICLFGDEVRLYFIVFRPACSASRCDRASFHDLKKAWHQLDMTCKWNKARPNWPKSTVSFTRHCGQSARHGGKLPRCRRQIRGLPRWVVLENNIYFYKLVWYLGLTHDGWSCISEQSDNNHNITWFRSSFQDTEWN